MPRTAATTVSSTTPPVAGSFDPARLRHPLEKRVEAIVTAAEAILAAAHDGSPLWGIERDCRARDSGDGHCRLPVLGNRMAGGPPVAGAVRAARPGAPRSAPGG